jgi:hypothetical protein
MGFQYDNIPRATEIERKIEELKTIPGDFYKNEFHKATQVEAKESLNIYLKPNKFFIEAHNKRQEQKSIDKKKEFKSLLFLSPDKNTVLYSSYGEDESNGKDIYQLKKMANGKWSPIPLNITSINTPLDEEYPCLSKDGKTLYFSSKGYENMGGYDIFKSEWNESTQSWLSPVNMGSPINSPFNDIYFLE